MLKYRCYIGKLGQVEKKAGGVGDQWTGFIFIDTLYVCWYLTCGFSQRAV